MSEQEKLEKIREFFIKQPLIRQWRIKKSQESAYGRYQLIQLLYDLKEPLTAGMLTFKTGRSLATIYGYLRVLIENLIICNRIDRLDGQTYYTICPVCPLKSECPDKLEFWIKSGLMNPEPSPSEKFMEEKKE